MPGLPETDRNAPAGSPGAFQGIAALMAPLRDRWRSLTSGSVNRKVFGATLIVGSMTLGTKVVSLVKESATAAAFGTGNALDAFIIALLVPVTISGILSGSLNAALIPTYIEVREREGDAAASRLYTTILMWNTVLLVAMSAVMALTVQFWLPPIASGFDLDKLLLTRHLFFASLPIVLITGFSTTWGALLNAGERFALVAIVPALEPLGIILALALALRAWGIYALLAGTLLGTGAQAAVLGAVLVRRGHAILPRWEGVTPAFRKVRAQYGACIASAFLVSGMGLVDQAFASSLGPRSNSALSYGSKLVSLVMTLGATALATAILPQLSKMVANRSWDAIRHFLRFYGRLILGVGIPFTLVLIALSRIVIRVMYQHGSFTAEDTDLVNRIQIFYLLRLPFSTCLVLVTRTLTALKANHYLLWMSFGSFTVNAVLDWLFIKSFGIAGITLSTSGVSVVVLTCLGIAMYRRLDKVSREEPA